MCVNEALDPELVLGEPSPGVDACVLFSHADMDFHCKKVFIFLWMACWWVAWCMQSDKQKEANEDDGQARGSSLVVVPQTASDLSGDTTAVAETSNAGNWGYYALTAGSMCSSEIYDLHPEFEAQFMYPPGTHLPRGRGRSQAYRGRAAAKLMQRMGMRNHVRPGGPPPPTTVVKDASSSSGGPPPPVVVMHAATMNAGGPPPPVLNRQTADGTMGATSSSSMSSRPAEVATQTADHIPGGYPITHPIATADAPGVTTVPLHAAMAMSVPAPAADESDDSLAVDMVQEILAHPGGANNAANDSLSSSSSTSSSIAGNFAIECVQAVGMQCNARPIDEHFDRRLSTRDVFIVPADTSHIRIHSLLHADLDDHNCSCQVDISMRFLRCTDLVWRREVDCVVGDSGQLRIKILAACKMHSDGEPMFELFELQC